MTWLLTGGAGYIGAHIARAFRAAGLDVVVLDDLSTGYREYVPDDVAFVDGGIGDPAAVRDALDHGVTGVVHLAGLKYAGVSVHEPLLFYRQNLDGMRVLLEAVVERGIAHFVFSSSSSWYGTPDRELVDEDTPPRPESPYGQTKVAGEWLLRATARANPGLAHTSLRYFNVVGSGSPRIADHSPHNLFPKVMRALSAGETPVIHGDDYPTADGTCIRDYIHVVDLADAHLAAARRLAAGEPTGEAYNVGRGSGSSVREVLEAIARITGIAFTPRVGPRRAGDPARIVGAVDRIAADFGWRARHDLDDMIASAWEAWRYQRERWGGAPPNGARLAIARV
ncbi:MAG TPA: UDP-glucose 4-epimerase GalE [Miltoncostaeaceae bacterium]|nr:UDP-glucose 4-epimerase GalE [Miltoncostaeaceae bacterium]